MMVSEMDQAATYVGEGVGAMKELGVGANVYRGSSVDVGASVKALGVG